MISQKRSNEELQKLLNEMVDEIKKIPQAKIDAKKDGLIDDDNFIKSCCPYIKKNIADEVSLSVQKYKEKKEKEEEIEEAKKKEKENIISPNSNNTVANYPLPEGTVIVHQFLENNIKKEQYYIIDRCLQQGGCGMTYIATYPGEKKGCKVVIKELYPFNKYRNIITKTIDWTWDKKGNVRENYERQFKNETNRIDKLIAKNKGNINKLNLVIPKTEAFDCFENKYYVMEFVNGNSLTNIIYSFKDDKEALEKMPLFCRLKIMQQLCYAILNLHNIECVHHDISPNNIMIDFDNDGNIQLKVIDYGLSTNLDQSINQSLSEFREGGTKCFTDTFYMDNEYKKADNEKQKLIDIYSLGAVLGWLCLLNIDYIKSEKFASNYEYMLKENTYFYQHEILENDNYAVITAKLQLNLIIKLVHDATVLDLNTRIQTITEFMKRLNQIMEINEDWVVKYYEHPNVNKKTDEDLVDNSADDKDEEYTKVIVINKPESDTEIKTEEKTVTLKPSGSKFKTLLLGLVIGVILSVGGYFVYEKINESFTDPKSPFTEEIEYINNWLKETDISSQALTSRCKKLTGCLDIKNWGQANDSLAVANNIRNEIDNIDLYKADSVTLDEIIQKTKVADSHYKKSEIFLDNVDLTTEMNELFIKARTDRNAIQEIKNKFSRLHSYIALKEGSSKPQTITESFDIFFGPVYKKEYIIGETHNITKVTIDNKNKQVLIVLEKIN